MLRLFVGIPLPEAQREQLRRLCHGIPGAKWVPPENLHLSLRFIGEVDERQAAGIDDFLADIQAPAFDLTLKGLGTFGPRNKARVLWVGVAPEPALEHLHDKVESAVVRAGLEPEGRKFSPHVTLARFRDAAPEHRLVRFMQEAEPFRAEPFTVTEFVLFRSHLGSDGAHYEALADYPLLGGGAA